jgi:hypothetical protein
MKCHQTKEATMPNDTAEPGKPAKPSLSPKLRAALENVTPEQRELAIQVAAKLLNIRAQREAAAKDGTVDLTQPKGKPTHGA